MPALQGIDRRQLQNLGCVLMTHKPEFQGAWIITTPNGEVLDITGSTSMGLQEAINYGWARGYVVRVEGGGITPPVGGVPISSLCTSYIVATDTIQFPTGWNNYFEAVNVNFLYDVDNSGNFFNFDSCDLTEVRFTGCQFIYPGTGNVFHFNPQSDNGEAFAGFTSSHFDLGNIVPVVSTINYAPDPTKGCGVRFSMPDLGLGLVNGDGIFVNCKIFVKEINGGYIGIFVEDPGAGNTFQDNHIECPALHGQNGACIQVGTVSSLDKIFGNVWTVNATAGTGYSLVTYAGGGNGSDMYIGAFHGGASPIQFGEGSRYNLVVASKIVGTVGNSSNYPNRVVTAVKSPAIKVSAASGSSPFTFFNRYHSPVLLWLSAGTISNVELSADGSSYGSGGNGLSNQYFYVPLGMYVRVTFSGGNLNYFAYGDA